MSSEQTLIQLDRIRLARSVAGLTATGAAGARYLVSIESPKPGQLSSRSAIQLSGWVISLGAPVQALRLTAPGALDVEIAVGVERLDVVRNVRGLLPGRELPSACGFSVCVLPCFGEPDRGARERVLWRLEAIVSGQPVPLASFCGQDTTIHSALAGRSTRIDERPVVIAGFHRSGTSALASLLADSGLAVGNELVPPQLANPDGHFEDCWAVDIDTAILHHNGADWTYAGDGPIDSTTEHENALAAYARRRSQESRLWAVKDPRAGLLLSEWSAAFPTLRAVAPVRHAEECARSLRLRQAAAIVRGVDPAAIDEPLRFWHDPDLPYRMWASHHAALLQHASRRPGQIAFVAQSELLRDPAAILEALNCPAAAGRGSSTAARAGASRTLGATGITPSTLAHVNELARRLQTLGGGDTSITIGEPSAADEDALLQRVEDLLQRIPFSGLTPVEWSQASPQRSAPAAAGSLQQVRALADRGRWLEAQWQLRALAAAPGALRPEVELTRARILAALGRWSEALAIHGRILSASPQHVDATLGAAECLLMSGEFRDAIDMVRQFLRLGAPDPWPWQRCARTVTRLNDARLALEFGARLSQACDRTSANWLAVCGMYEMRRGHATAADAWIDQAAALQDAAPLVHEALQERLLRKGQPALAARLHAQVFAASHDRAGYRSYVRRVCARVPSSTWRAALLGDIAGELDRIAGHFASPDSPPGQRPLPRIERAEAAVACGPIQLGGELPRTDNMVERGHAREAVAKLRELVRPRSANPSAWVALSRAAAADGDREEALRISAEAIDACPDADWIWLRHLRMLDALGRRPELERQVNSRPAPELTDSVNFVPWSRVMLGLGEHRRVQAAIDARSQSTTDTLANVKGASELLLDLAMRLGQPLEAIEIVRNELSRSENDPRLLRRLFDLALWTGDAALAEDAAGRLHALDPLTHCGLPMFLLHETRIFRHAMRDVSEAMRGRAEERLRELSRIVVAEPGCLPAAFAWMNQFVADRAAHDEASSGESRIPRLLLHDKQPSTHWRDQHGAFEWVDFGCERQLKAAFDVLPASKRARLARVPKLPLLDIARLALVNARGGWWVNPTVDCRAPVDRLGAGASVVLSLDDSGWLSDAPFGSAPDEPVIARALDVALSVSEEVLVRDNASPLTTGMPALTLGLALALAPRVIAGEPLDHVRVTTPIQRWRRLGLWWPE